MRIARGDYADGAVPTKVTMAKALRYPASGEYALSFNCGPSNPLGLRSPV